MASSPMCAHRLRYFVISTVRAALISFAALGILLNFLCGIDFFRQNDCVFVPDAV